MSSLSHAPRRRRGIRAAARRLRQFRSRRTGSRATGSATRSRCRANARSCFRAACRACRAACRLTSSRATRPPRCRTSRPDGPRSSVPCPRSRRPSRSRRPNRSPSRRWSQETGEPERRPTPVTVRPQRATAAAQPQRSQQTAVARSAGAAPAAAVQWPDPPGAAPDLRRDAAARSAGAALNRHAWLRLRLGRGIERPPPNAPVSP